MPLCVARISICMKRPNAFTYIHLTAHAFTCANVQSRRHIHHTHNASSFYLWMFVCVPALFDIWYFDNAVFMTWTCSHSYANSNAQFPTTFMTYFTGIILYAYENQRTYIKGKKLYCGRCGLIIIHKVYWTARARSSIALQNWLETQWCEDQPSLNGNQWQLANRQINKIIDEKHSNNAYRAIVRMYIGYFRLLL